MPTDSSPCHPALYTYVDLFAGAGGLSLGFEQAGFKCVDAIDIWPPATRTYSQNLKGPVRTEAITEATVLAAADVFIGGPPCQGFSSAGARKSVDERNDLVSVFASLVGRYLPKIFVFENVEGFLTAGDGYYVDRLLTPLIAAGYCIHLRKVNVANYGVPQLRKRVIAIGGLGCEPSFPSFTHSAFGAPGSMLANSPDRPPVAAVGSIFATLQDYADGLEDHAPSVLSEDDLARVHHLKQGQSMRDLPDHLWHSSFRRRAFRRVQDGTPTEKRGGAPFGIRRLRADEPCRAITGAASREFIHPYEDRPLTIRECALIQTFPPNFAFSGNQSEKMLQIGNAVPPAFAFRMADSLRRDMQAGMPSKPCGALLSFVPTLSSGMSPKLQVMARRVRQQFASQAEFKLHAAI